VARKKNEDRFPIDGQLWDIESTPWGQEAEYRREQSAEAEPFSYWRDHVILSYLDWGDVRPLVAFIMTGEAPGPAVLRYIAAMLGEPTHDSHLDLPFKLTIKGRDGAKARDRELEWRDFLLSKNVEKEMVEGKKYEHAAVPDIAALSGLDKSTVRKAYDKHHPKNKSKNN